MAEQPCISCGGKGWKYVSQRRGLIGGLPGAALAFIRVRDDCSLCQGQKVITASIGRADA